MFPVFKLKNHIKHYEWGSPMWIPCLLNEKNPDNSPCAELWMGVHSQGASETEYNGHSIELPRLLSEKSCLLGADLSSLPFLFKVLAVEKPLSIQVHPNAMQAAEGFERENKAGIPLDAPQRNYKDPNHKPEIICAVSPFRAMAGFRDPTEIHALLDTIPCAALDAYKKALSQGLQVFLRVLFETPLSERRLISGALLSQKSDVACGARSADAAQAWETAASFVERYPDDPAVLSPFYLNLISLNEGEAFYLDAGVPHAYIHGFGVEVMANSDNVLRGGLTSKHIDMEEFFRVLDFTPSKPSVLHPSPSVYPAPCQEFSLSVMQKTGEWETDTPAIAFVTQGAAEITGEDGEITLKQGESAFIGVGNRKKLSVTGNFTLYIATAGGFV